MKEENNLFQIKTIVTDVLNENCYIIEKNNNVLVIDPGSSFNKIDEYLKGKNVLKILITHNHFDHVGAVDDIINKYNVEVLKYDNLEEKEYNIGPFRFNVIFTPGHSSDSVTYYFKNNEVMFVGDFIFEGNIGRCDLPTGDYQVMLSSISKIKKYNPDIIIYPGHGNKTILKKEIENNIYFK